MIQAHKVQLITDKASIFIINYSIKASVNPLKNSKYLLQNLSDTSLPIVYSV